MSLHPQPILLFALMIAQMTLSVPFACAAEFTNQIESVDHPYYGLQEELRLFSQSYYGNILPALRLSTSAKAPGSTADLLRHRVDHYRVDKSPILNRVLGGSGSRAKAPWLGLRFQPYSNEVFSSNARPVHRIGINGELWAGIANHWQMHLRARLENHGELYPQFNGRIWEDKITGWLDNAAVYFYRDGFFGSIGRSFLTWGPEQRDALLLSAHSPAFDRIWLGYEHRTFRFDYFLTRLDDVVDEGSVLVRYLSAHRLSIRKARWFEFGLSEVALYGGQNRPLEWHYLNPFLPYYWEQWNRGTDDNIFFGADLIVYWPGRARIFAELMVDDFQIDFRSEPHQVAYKVGVDAAEPFGWKRTFSKFSYTRVNTTVYGQNKPQNLYLHYSQPIGYFGGNDQDRLLLLIRRHLSQQWDIEIELQYNRRGEGRVEKHERWGVEFEEKFPTGVVEKSPSVRLGVLYFGKSLWEVRLDATYTHHSNFQHRQDRDESRFELNLYFSYYLPGVFN